VQVHLLSNSPSDFSSTSYSYPMHSCALPSGDQKLIQIVNAALADSAQRSGKWLACKPGCSQCCVGVFAINQLDAIRLRKGFEELQAQDAERAGRIQGRARAAMARFGTNYPGDLTTGVLDPSEEMYERWNNFANDETCPALHPEAGTCELYEHRPFLCRTFGPPIMDEEEDELGVCDLCFDGATDEETAVCEMHPDPENLQPGLLKEVETATGVSGETIITWVLAQ
jgi:Fe-S-cluster containining protein